MTDEEFIKEKGTTHPIYAKEGETVVIHWRLRDGHLFAETRTCPPAETRKVRQATGG